MFKYNLMHNIKIQINKDYTKTTNEIKKTPFYAIMWLRQKSSTRRKYNLCEMRINVMNDETD